MEVFRHNNVLCGSYWASNILTHDECLFYIYIMCSAFRSIILYQGNSYQVRTYQVLIVFKIKLTIKIYTQEIIILY